MISPEECPDPSAHKIFRYCPYCSWMDEATDYETVETAITKALNERRNDAEFIGRLKASIERHGVILDRLAESDGREKP